MDLDPSDDGLHLDKHEDLDGLTMSEKKALGKALNRVSRACNACRKQKMRCEGAENPPCKRCRNAGLQCVFEKPSREASLTGEAGLERIRSLEGSVHDIRQSQLLVQHSLDEILAHLRGGNALPAPRAQAYPTYVQTSPITSSPSMRSQGSVPTPTPANAHLMTGSSHVMPPPPASGSYSSHASLSSILSPAPNDSGYRDAQSSTQIQQQQGMVHPQTYAGANGQPLMGAFGPGHHQPPRYDGQPQHAHAPAASSSLKRPGVSVTTSNSNSASADSSDNEREDDGELPTEGMVRPWEVLRSLADVAVQQDRIKKITDSAPPSRARTPPPPHKGGRAAKRRKTAHQVARNMTYPDVVTKNIISEAEARELFRIFYHGCSTFLPVFDQAYDTYDALHERSPFAVDCICMVAALIRDKGGKPSDTYQKCLEEVHSISQATLFAPVTRLEVVQAMLIVAGWSDNGWLPGGHAVRMAMELGMHTAWPKLLKRMRARTTHKYTDDRTLVASCRTWFSLYIFEHQISYGTGRPAILKDDESIAECRLLLDHPLAVPDDMRLVSTVELMAVRERVNNQLSPLDRPIDEHTFQVLHDAEMEFQIWYKNWDQPFAERYEDAAFYRQSLHIQHMHAELFHNANALRNINGFEDVVRMPTSQRALAVRSIRIARQCLEITLNSPAYREGMKYAVHYTHVTATFTATLLLRLSRLFPEECSFEDARQTISRLAGLLSEIPGKRYALTLMLMLKHYKARRQASMSRSPQTQQQQVQRPPMMHADSSGVVQAGQAVETPFSPTYGSFSGADGALMLPPGPVGQMPAQFAADAANIDIIWRGIETSHPDQLPVWISDSSLGGNHFTQHGMNAFILPQDLMPATQQIW